MQKTQDFQGRRTPGEAGPRDTGGSRDSVESIESATDSEETPDLPPSLLARLRAEAPPHRRSLFRR